MMMMMMMMMMTTTMMTSKMILNKMMITITVIVKLMIKVIFIYDHEIDSCCGVRPGGSTNKAIKHYSIPIVTALMQAFPVPTFQSLANRWDTSTFQC